MNENTVSIEIVMDSAAFEYGAHFEVSRILRDLADAVLLKGIDGVSGVGIIRDSNGNQVGTMAVSR